MVTCKDSSALNIELRPGLASKCLGLVLGRPSRACAVNALADRSSSDTSLLLLSTSSPPHAAAAMVFSARWQSKGGTKSGLALRNGLDRAIASH